MLGIAQKLFSEKEKRFPWKTQKPQHTWPLLDSLLANHKLADVDYAFAEKLLKPFPQSSEEVAAFLCHLSLTSRSGHLCLRIEDKSIIPFRDLWMDADTTPSNQEMEALTTLILRGVELLPSELMTETLCRFNNLYYLQRNWNYETRFLQHWRRIALSKPTIQFKDVKPLDSLLPEQKDAIIQASQQCLTIITGGPGTGKTYTAGQLIRCLWESMSAEERSCCELALAAPTGKAASQLQSSLQKALGDLELKNVTAKTLHALLGIKSRGSESSTLLSADVILVDESSMIDVRIMAQLFESIKPGARLILLGDQHQLPPVETGGLFFDLVQHHRPIQQLKTCMRAELKSIVDFAQAINQGNIEHTLSILNRGDLGVCRFPWDEEEPRKMQELLLQKAFPYFIYPEKLLCDPQKLLDETNRFRILSSLRRGPFGAEEINRSFYKHALQRKSKYGWLITPIMITRSDPQVGLLNGEVGILVSRDGQIHEGDYALFSSSRRVSAFLLPKYEHAYCLSVHKSQGSEFERILLIHPQGGEVFGREMLYTAATRARRSIEVASSDETISSTIQRKSSRQSGIGKRGDHD